LLSKNLNYSGNLKTAGGISRLLQASQSAEDTTMNFEAIEHHAFDNYCYPLNKDELEINIRTGRDIKKIFLVWGDPFAGGILGGNWEWKGTRVEITKVRELQKFLWWTIVVKPEFKRCRYYFELHSADGIFYCCEDGFYTESEFKALPFNLSCFTFPWMNEADICTPPDWPGTTVWYQIFPSRFSRGTGCKGAFAGRLIKTWAGPEQKVKNEEEYGGNLQGITGRLDYLAGLGITGIYLNPVNLSSTQHKYDTTDYLEIDPSFGTKQDMKRLVSEAHKRHMRIMLDGVFNHSGWDFFAWQDVLKNRKKSKYAGWYMITDFDFPAVPGDNSAKGKYYAFAFADSMPKLNTNNPEVTDYLLKVCETWVKEYDIDALRLDVANEISHAFCRKLQERMRALKSDFYIVGEIWHNSLPWLRGNEFDAVMNYSLQNTISNFALTDTLSAKQFEQNINRCLTMYFRQTEEVLLNQMDSHDTIRLATKSVIREKALQQLVFLFAMPGSVCIYYGTEVLLAGGHDPDCRRCMPWKEIEEGKYTGELRFMKTLIMLRRTHPALRGYDVQFVYDEKEADQNPRIVHIRKISDDGTETIDVLFNFGNSPCRAVCADKNILLSLLYDAGVVQKNGFVMWMQLRTGSA
jgi:cyclomaltodextrinase / maltogenic alpha-amylase / neopullulanase